jgi:GTPase SAR1 family protein
MSHLPIEPIPCESKPQDKRIQQLNYKNLPKLPATFLILGRAGSGKSSILHSLITKGYTYGKGKKSVFDECISYLGTLDAIDTFKKLPIKNNVVLQEFDPDDFIEYLDDLKAHQMEKLERNKPPLNTLIVFDDFVGNNLMKSHRGKASPLERLALTSRHECNATLAFNAQCYKNTGFATTTIRNNVTTYIISNMTRPEIEKIAEEHCNDLTPKEFIQVYDQIMKKPYNFMVIDYRRPLNARITEQFHIPIKKPSRLEQDDEEEERSSTGSRETSE